MQQRSSPLLIKTTGQLRELLARQLVELEAGRADIVAAREITRTCSQINTSFDSEVRASRVRLDAGLAVARFGAQPLGISED